MLTWIAQALAAVVLLALAAGPALADRRVALVIGINDYGSVPPLRKAVNDASAIGKALADVGFQEIIIGQNLNYTDFATKLDEFERRLKPGDTAFFFFAGHGFEIRGENYLLPTDVPAARENQEGLIRNRSFAVPDILDRIQARKIGAAVFILDACRNNPFERSGARSIGAGGGLAPVEAPRGVFVMMSAGVKQTALDRLSETDPDPNSVFTRVLLKELRTPQTAIRQIAKNVQTDVERLAKTVEHEQTPAYYDQVVGEFYFRAPEPKPSPVPRPDPLPRPPRADAVAQCDRLAASPHDQSRPPGLPGVALELIEPRTAIEICDAAIRTQPGLARLRYQRGRAYHANKDFDQARSSYEDAAQNRYAAAQVDLGELYREGLGTPKSLSHAALLLRQAMPHSARAQTNLGLMFIHGQIPGYERGSDASYAAGRQLLEQALARGDDEAAFWLGVMHYRGRGAPQDFRLAETYFQAASQAGHRRAMLHLGSLYRDWNGRPGHFDLARRYWEGASHLGSSQATHNLGEYYANGWGGGVDLDRACYYYERASEMGQGDSWAKYATRCVDRPTGSVPRAFRR